MERGGAPTRSAEVPTLNSVETSDANASVVRMNEAAPDREGKPVTPRYTELVAASTEATTSKLRMILRFASRLPDSMVEDDRIFMTGFNVWAGKREFALSVTLDDEGWVSAFEERNEEELKGRLHRAGRSIVFELRRDLVGEVRVLRWIAGAVLTKTHPTPLILAHDLVPNDGDVRHRLR
jgi:hypothetical protein